MKLNNNPFLRSNAFILAGSIAVLFGGHVAQAASSTWLNTGVTDGNWNTSTNWVSGTIPGSTAAITGTNANTDVATFDTIPGTFGYPDSPILIDSTSENINGITFDTAAGGYFIGTTAGNSLFLSSGGTIQILATLTEANVLETIDAPLVIEGASGTYTFLNGSANGSGTGAGTLNFGGQIRGGAAGATGLTLTGTNTNANTISGSIVNGSATSLAITKALAGNWILTGANSYTGATTINAGTLTFSNAGSQSLGALNGVGRVVNAFDAGTLAFTQAASTTYSIGTITNNNPSGATGAFTLNAGAGSITTIGTINGANGSVVNLGGNSTGTTNLTSPVDTPGQTVNFNAGIVNLNGSLFYRSNLVFNGATVITRTGGVDYFQIGSFSMTAGSLLAQSNYGFRMGSTFGATTMASSVFTGTQSGGTFNITSGEGFQMGGSSGSFVSGYSLGGGTLNVAGGNLNVGANTAGTGSTTFTLSGSGKLVTAGTIKGAQGSGAVQNFVFNGGQLTAKTIDMTNLTTSGATAGVAATLANNGGTLAPGDIGTGGKTVITGNYSVTSASASYAVDLGSNTIATNFQNGAAFYDTTTVTGALALGGTLNVSLINGFIPAAQTFTILTGASITGSFSNVSGGKVALAGGATFDVINTGTTLTLSNYAAGGGGSTYASWKTTNGTTQAIDLDHDSDGASNGVEYFIGGNSNTTGFTALPAIVTVGSARSITFIHAASYLGVYGTDYVIETSASLTAGSWATEVSGVNVTFPTSTTVKYTFPTDVKNFARLRVTGP